MTLISSQATTLDYLQVPWVYDPNIGPKVAPREPQSGDGMYRYALQNGEWVVEKNPSPTAESEFQRRFDESIERTMQCVRAQRMAESEVNFSDSDDAESDPNPAKSACTQTSAPSTARMVSVTNASRVARLKVCLKNPNSAPRVDKNASYDAMLRERGCVIDPVKRESNGRMDMRILDPVSGKRFRSRLEAMRFFGI